MSDQQSVKTDGITHRFVEANGIRMHFADQGEGPLVVLLHGFPESWYSWRHQLPALAAAGYHAVAPDLRGYGQTDRPEGVEKYSQLHLVGDVDTAAAGSGRVLSGVVSVALVGGAAWLARTVEHRHEHRPGSLDGRANGRAFRSGIKGL